MGEIADGFNTAFREWQVDGVPASGANPPAKAEAKALGALIEAAMAAPGEVISLVGGAHTLTLDHLRAWLEISNAGDCILTIPAHADVAFPVGAMIEGAWGGVGALSFDGDVGVDVVPADNQEASTDTSGSVFGLKQVSLDTWRVFGNLTAA